MTNENKIPETYELIDVDKRVKEFVNMLERNIEIDPKLKMLWIEIYKHAQADRNFAGILYVDLLNKIMATTENHGLYGDKIAKYLERMSKANDQLLLLAKYVSEHVAPTDDMTPDQLYDKIAG